MGHGNGEISRSLFNFVMMTALVGALGVTAACATYSTGWMEFVPATSTAQSTFKWVGPINMWVLSIGVFVSGLVGISVSLNSDQPVVSLFGFAMLAVPFGFLLGPVVGMYTVDSVVKVMFITGAMTIVLGLIGTVIPDSLESWSGWLFGTLTILLIGSIGIPFMGYLIPGFPIKGVLTAMDWVGVILFSGYIIYDMNRAQHVYASTDNAIDCALAVYLDIINLFIKLLRLSGILKGSSNSSSD